MQPEKTLSYKGFGSREQLLEICEQSGMTEDEVVEFYEAEARDREMREAMNMASWDGSRCYECRSPHRCSCQQGYCYLDD